MESNTTDLIARLEAAAAAAAAIAAKPRPADAPVGAWASVARNRRLFGLGR